MASPLRLPAGPLFFASRSSNTVSQTYSTTLCQCRFFSQSSQRQARGIAQQLTMKQPAQPSIKTRSKELSRSELPQDIGLLPGTYIRPLWRDMPSIFEQPRERLQMEWLWVKNGAQNFIGLLAYCKWINTGLPLRLKERRQVARDLYQAMYRSFAVGDVATIRKICCTGLANSLTSRISHRPKDQKVTWSLEKFLRTPGTLFTGVRVVSDRATQIPELPDSGVRQVVLRITSRQSTGKTTVTSKNEEASTNEPAKQQDCTEYIVLQKFRWTGEEDDWRIWGHATPTTVEDLDSPFFASGVSLADRLEAMKSSMGGGKR